MLFVIYIILIFLFLSGCRLQKYGEFNDHYISKEQCNCIKGFFIAVVFCRHIAPYLSDAGYDFSFVGDHLFLWIDGHIGQLLVVMFLFYSGYGVTESIKKRGKEYVRQIPRKRLLVTLANFDIAVFLFLVVDSFLSIEYPPKDVLLSFTGWKSIGNSNWYIFVILCCYLSSYLTYRITVNEKMNRKLFGGGNLFFIICIYLLLLLTKQRYWYDTIFSYPLGVYYSLYRGELENVLKRNYSMALVMFILAFVLLMSFNFGFKGVYANFKGCVMAILIVLMSMKIELHSKPLSWLGKNLFPLYIYQRIGMIVLSHIDGGEFVVSYPYLYIIVCAILTLVLGWLYRYVQIK